MLDSPFSRDFLHYETLSMKMMRDRELREKQLLTRNPFEFDDVFMVVYKLVRPVCKALTAVNPHAPTQF